MAGATAEFWQYAFPAANSMATAMKLIFRIFRSKGFAKDFVKDYTLTATARLKCLRTPSRTLAVDARPTMTNKR
jgi:hypothetical protein